MESLTFEIGKKNTDYLILGSTGSKKKVLVGTWLVLGGTWSL